MSLFSHYASSGQIFPLATAGFLSTNFKRAWTQALGCTSFNLTNDQTCSPGNASGQRWIRCKKNGHRQLWAIDWWNVLLCVVGTYRPNDSPNPQENWLDQPLAQEAVHIYIQERLQPKLVDHMLIDNTQALFS